MPLPRTGVYGPSLLWNDWLRSVNTQRAAKAAQRYASKKMKIRKAKKQDLKKVSELFKVEYAKKPYNEKWTPAKASTKIKQYFKTNFIHVLEVEKEITGFIVFSAYLWHDGKRGLIDEIVVSAKHQGKGYGKALLKYAEKYLRKKGIKKLNLFSVKKSKAFKFYKQNNFKEEDFVSMVKQI